MPPRIHFVRHAQGFHNISLANWSLIDPLLTEKGKQQCVDLRDRFPHHSSVELIVSSPLRRTIYTAWEAFQPVFQAHEDLEMILLPDLRELSAFPCDTGCEPGTLKEEMDGAGVPVDIGFVHDGWTEKSGRYKPTIETTESRARDTRRWLRDRPEKEIVVVTHGAMLHFLTEDWEDSCAHEATGWENTEYRSYDFQATGDAILFETPESRLRRGKTGLIPTPEEQLKLREVSIPHWESQGYTLSGSSAISSKGTTQTVKEVV
ncbi:hypothetical protein ASPWEDRAFT_40169 [Aspergillus wentii DTO 134E9]|uniref:Uncharacterized protein n=1 Tax=Aspergillus wentii DTO 134E9 TaxID=1073089 RepID=A0A1L9RJL1_ASPWE|nr:uncharacterized protein ASPWEDRAFT_40169 [Aspergillus wentii DTO 134E9]OJJ35037.1 hypothetical protein ASPWEDRAFT_40169 [Aspergillus wentii DTO 134E9]